jgi:two-component system nitrogen regulation response regulator NtrX
VEFDILIVDDEKDIRDLVSGILEDEGYSARSASSCVEAIDSINFKLPSLLIIDVWLGNGERDGLRLLEFVKKRHSYLPIIMMSGHATIETAVTAIKEGAYDFIEKPFDSARLLVSISRAIETFNLKRENEQLKIKARSSYVPVGNSSYSNNLLGHIQKVSSLNGRCFIFGPVGSDKEWVVSEIHRLSSRSNGPLVFVNCQNQSQSKFEIDLFGAMLESDSGKTIRTGLIEQADNGIMYFDEIHLLSKEIQNKLRRVLTEGSFSRLGSSSKIKVDIRFFAGSSENIKDQIKDGNFSEDLFYRLAANTIKLTPLRDRIEDVPALVDSFMRQASLAYNTPYKTFSKDAMAVLSTYHWPGDVSQLKNLVDWVLIMSMCKKSTNTIELDDLPSEITDDKSFSPGFADFMASFSSLSIKEARDAFEKEYLTAQLRRFSGNISQTSRFVGMERSALHRKIRYLNISDKKNHCWN